MTFHKKSLAMAIVSSLGIIASAQAAQLQEIVITAEFRANDVQDTPIAITAMTGDMLEARNQNSVYEVAAQAPNVELKPQRANFGPAIQSSIRGIGQTDFNPAKEPGVGMYVDDVYYSTMTGTMFDLLDLDRIEILRGPQGTLSGRNSIGGAIKLFSRQPGSAPGYVEATVGSDNRVDLKLAVDFELSDTFAGRISAVSRDQDGYVDIKDFTSGSTIGELGGKDSQGIRGNFVWTPTADLEVNVILDATRDNSDRGAEVLDPRTTNPALKPYIDDDRDVVYGQLFEGDPVNNVPYSIDPDIELNSEGISGKVTWDINEVLQLTSITAYRQYDSSWAQDQDMTPIAINHQTYTLDNEQFTQELRLNGYVGELLDYTVGVYYMDAESLPANRIDIPPIIGFESDDVVEAESRAIFAHGVWHLTDRINLTTGLRYTEEEKELGFARYMPGTSIMLPGFPFASGADAEEVDYRVALDFQLSDDVLLYGQVSTGFKGGGLNPRAFNEFQLISYEPETLTAYELGFKSALLDNKMRLNGAVFHMDYEDIQIQSFGCSEVDPTPAAAQCTPIRNAGEADVQGVELEVQYYPTDNLSIDASASWLDFEYTKISDPATGISKGSTNALTPETKFSLGLQYDLPLASGASITSRLDISYQDESYSQIPVAPSNLIEDYTIANARVAWKSEDENWTVTAGVLNLTDEEYDLANNDLQVFGGVIGVTPARGREYTVGIRRSF